MKSIYDSIQNIAKGTHLAVRRFSFFLLTPEILNKSNDMKLYENTLLWKIETDKEGAILLAHSKSRVEIWYSLDKIWRVLLCIF